jgi:selenocysteine-specific elongation factor
VKRLILGTAGHIDHGKTALVRALTGVDTDRLKEEKERGITIDLGFAELADEEVRLGIVDVPGHEGFIRNMLAGATGMDVVLLVVAADEGVMPQTREHLAIVRLLGVERLVVALTKADLVEEEWLELVRDDVTELLKGTGLEDAPLIATSARESTGLDRLTAALREAARGTRGDRRDDVARLPVDRVFTVKGTGTVVTGTLWSGRLAVGTDVVVRPGPRRARIRGLQVHGRDVEEAVAGERTAVALSGSAIDRQSVSRGDVLVDLEEWPETHMLTVRAQLLLDPGWSLRHNQRLRVHVGTAEVLARTVLLGAEDELAPGESGWIQLRLESAVLARARERLVLRSYSPMTTIGGGVIAEPSPPKRKHLDPATAEALTAVLEGDTVSATEAVLRLAGWSGLREPTLPVRTGFTPASVDPAVATLRARGTIAVGGSLLGAPFAREGELTLLGTVEAFHQAEPLRPGAPLETLRDSLPATAPAGTADTLLQGLFGSSRLERKGDVAAIPGFSPELSEEQRGVRRRLGEIFAEAGLAPPSVEELSQTIGARDDLWPILKLMESDGSVTALDEGFFVETGILERASEAVRREFAGRTGLGPADFRQVLPVTRRHLIPLLGWMDRHGVTVRRGEGREVPGARHS